MWLAGVVEADGFNRSGVAAGRTPPAWLKHGDVVEVSLEGVGSCTNSVEFVKSGTSKL